ncbi:DUF1232 domain-containing protein [Pseudogracilibacillus auburnensis]|uniref:Uncharacterized membrane protein YkvA (DUF1232 family) n=1 Tax=Pseudogracilibacillus auburnensis TaxID=1494959 RepID=A0A2V3W4Z1_9BACI|nr:DUF1232 domain-containing protein [Pseudogracilibacillus auburnensis]PXW83819.1 uncharacterized membrane protein YkvA (DUF1232 family) [Pseudogracilibacillus auburnensis]
MMVEKNNQLGVILKDLLKKHSLSMRKLSEQTNIDTATISRIVNGKRKATLEHLEKFSEHLHISLHELLEAAGYPLEQGERRSETNEYVGNIQSLLETAELSELPIKKIDQKLADFTDFAQTEEGKETIDDNFEEKIKKVDSVGPFITHLKDFYERFRSREGTPRELILIGGALLYFIAPVDVIPDYIFPVGYLDDAIAIQIVMRSLSKE